MNPYLRLSLIAAFAPVLVAQDAGSTYGHARTRAMAALGRLPTPTDVAVADIVNFHRHRLPLPHAGEPIALDVRFGSPQFDHRGEAVLQIGFTTAPVGDRHDLPPLNLGLVIDCSGSMAADGKLDAVQRALRVLFRRLRPEDRIALVTYSSDATLRGSGPRGDGRWLSDLLDELEPGGSTDLHGGLMVGLREVASHAAHGAHSRVILLTDGIANRGETDPEVILRDARRYTAEDVDLATIGVGAELNAELLDRLARGARGMFHFVADAKDVQKVFVDELEAQVAVVARAVRLRVGMPRDVEVVRVFGFDARPLGEGGAFEIDLADLNAGATQVVVVAVRLRDRSDGPETLRVSAELAFREARDGRRGEVQGTATIGDDRGLGDRLADPEVRKNFTIATVAQGLHDMAVAAEGARWADADRSLRRALRFARAQFPSREDPDLQRVVEMAESLRVVLRGYLDRFRDG